MQFKCIRAFTNLARRRVKTSRNFTDGKSKQNWINEVNPRKLNLTLPRSSLLIIYKSFIRPHLDYGDIVYGQPNNSSLSEKIESLKYNAALAITSAIKGSSKEKLYQELGFESLKDRRWMRKLCYLHKVISSKRPSYLHYKDLNETKVSFSLCCVERKSSKTPFYRIR